MGGGAERLAGAGAGAELEDGGAGRLVGGGGGCAEQPLSMWSFMSAKATCLAQIGQATKRDILSNRGSGPGRGDEGSGVGSNYM